MLAAADGEDFTWTTTFSIMQSLRLDSGAADQFTPDPIDIGKPAGVLPGVARFRLHEGKAEQFRHRVSWMIRIGPVP